MAAAALTPGRPRHQGLYDPANEHDACGVGMVADLHGRASHDIVQNALTVLKNLDHRGAVGAEPDDGDGVGIMLQIPDAFFREVSGLALPEPGAYAAGIAFLPADADERAAVVAHVETLCVEEGLTVLGWRELPTDPAFAGPAARRAMPHFAQLFLRASENGPHAGRTGLELDRVVFCMRERAEQDVNVYFPSLSSRTIVYKGMLTTRSWSRSSPTCRTAGSPARSRSCTRGSPPTRSRRGSWRTRSGSSPTTARSTRSRGTGTGCGPARRC